MILKLVMQHQGLKLYKVSITDDPRLTLTYFTARSNSVAYASELGKLQSLNWENLHEPKFAPGK